MENNIYTAPEAELLNTSNSNEQPAEYYVISQTKLWVFGILSFGIFLIPWNYLQWRRVKQTEASDIWPAPRAIFSIFFINSLFKLFDVSLKQKEIEYKWSPGLNAGMYVLFILLANVIDHVAEKFTNEFELLYWVIFFAGLIIPLWAVSNAQRVANLAVGDPSASSNSRWTVSNYLWGFFLALIWGLAVAGLFYAEA